MIKELTTLINLKTTYNNMLLCNGNNFYLTIIIVYLICLNNQLIKNVKDALGLLDLETTVLRQQVYQ